MDFARKQLEKYGWTDGKGLGRHENGISEAIKPKLKRSAAGIGHDPASEFNEHWWTTLYDKAAGNVEVHEKNGITKRIKTKEEFQITNSTWKLKQKPKADLNEEQYSEFFVRTAVLTNGGNKIEKLKESESEEEEKRDVFKMTDEELFKACKGRTAHKGARHGLKATGKLARIAQQEALLLVDSKFDGYSHANKLKERFEEINLDNDSVVTQSKKKRKKKRKCCYSKEKPVDNILDICDVSESSELSLPENNEAKKCENVTSFTKKINDGRKSKKSKRKHLNHNELVLECKTSENITNNKKRVDDELISIIDRSNDNASDSKVKHKKKKRK